MTDYFVLNLLTLLLKGSDIMPKKLLHKRIISIILIFGLILPIIPVSQSSAEIIGGLNWKADIVNGKAENAYIDGTITDNIIVPPTINGYPVVSLGRITDYDSLLRNGTISGKGLYIDLRQCTTLKKINTGLLRGENPKSVIKLYCDNPNIDFSDFTDTTPSEFKWVGPTQSTAREKFSNKYESNGIPTIKAFIEGGYTYFYAGQNASVGAAYCTVPIPERYGQKFTGYTYNGTTIYLENGNLNPAGAMSLDENLGSVQLTAGWDAKPVTITYHDPSYPNGSYTEQASYGVSQMSTNNYPSKTGHSFVGWSKTPNSANAEISAGGVFTPDGNMDLYSVWSENEYTLVFNPNGGNGGGSTQTIKYGRLTTMTMPGAEAGAGTKEGYEFAYWAFDAAGDLRVSEGSQIPVRHPSGATINLYAIWGQGNITVHYNTGDRSTDTFLMGGTATLLVPRKDGHVFAGWSLSSTLGTNDYPGGTPITMPTDKGKDIYLYAIFNPITYTIHFSTYDTADSGSMSDITVTYGEKTALPLCGFTRTGYVFAGWNVNKIAPVSGQSAPVNYQDGQTISGNDTQTNSAVVTLYPVWIAGAYKITYNLGTSDAVKWTTENIKTSYIYGDTYILPTPVREGYVFTGWTDAKNNKITAISQTDDKDITVIAHWKEVGACVKFADKYVVEADVDGKTILLNSINTEDNDFDKGKVIKKLTLTLSQAIEYTGIKVTDSSGQVIADKGELSGRKLTVSFGNGYTLNGDITVAIYGEAKKFNITYDLDGGEFKGDYPKQYTYGAVLPLPTNVEKNAYIFHGWIMENGKIVKELPDTTIGDITLKAFWANGTYSATINLNGGTTKDERFKEKVTTLDFQFNSGNIDLPGDVTKDGYDFLGWYDMKTQSYVDYIQTGLPTDHILYAMFSANAGVGFISNVIQGIGTTEKKNLMDKDDKVGFYYYDKLSELEKKIYTTVYKHYRYEKKSGQVSAGMIDLVSKDEFTRDSVLHACAAVCRDHPELFWIRFFDTSNSQRGSAIGNDGMYYVTVCPRLAYRQEVAASDVLEYDAFYQAVVDSLINLDIKKMTVQDQIALINKYVCENYSYRNLSNILSAVTSNETRSVGYFLSHKEGCCEAYAKLTMLLLREFGIEATVVTSSTHMWNEVKINGTWYALDTTWNDYEEEKKVLTDYLLVGENKVKDSDHKIKNYFYLEADAKDPGSVKTSPVLSYGCFEAPKVGKADYGVKTYKGINYTLKGKTAVVTKCTKVSKKIKIPKTIKIDGIKAKVTQIGKNAFKGKKAIKTFVLPESIKKIGSNAFKGIYKKATFKAKKKLRKLILKAGAPKTVKFS